MLLDDYDIWSDVGPATAATKSTQVTSDGNIDIDFGTVTEKPIISAIQILEPGSSSQVLKATPAGLGFADTELGAASNLDVVLSNEGSPGDPAITISSSGLTGSNAGDFTDDFADTDVTLQAGETTTVVVRSRRRHWVFAVPT